jgi:Lrp/AsnC family transcriptional regulator, leucine-responsive regulatory protein
VTAPPRSLPIAPGTGPAPLQEIKARILAALSLDARATFSDIADRLGLSRQQVKYHFDQLEAQKIIENCYAILNVVRLGYLYHRVLIRLANVPPETEREILDYFARHPRVGWVIEHQGPWHIALVIWTHSMSEFELALDEMLSDVGRDVADKLISFSAKTIHLKKKFLTGEPDDTTLVVGGNVPEVALDELDYEILGVITKSARKSYREIGLMLSVSPKVVKYRMQRMINAGVILGFDVKLDHKMLGFTHHKVFLKLANISSDSIDDLTEHLLKLTNTTCITKSIGFSDLEFEVMVRDNSELHATLKDIRYAFPDLIREESSLIVSREAYVNYLPWKK